jgi:hypothetical protein
MLEFAEIGSKERLTRTDWLTCALKYSPRSLGCQKFRARYQLSVLDQVNMLKQSSTIQHAPCWRCVLYLLLPRPGSSPNSILSLQTIGRPKFAETILMLLVLFVCSNLRYGMAK